MQLSPLCLVLAAGLTTLGVGQAVLPTAHAQATPPYQAAVKSLHIAHTKSGLETTGIIVNTGLKTLTYTSVILVFKTADGAEAAQMPAYLAIGPVGPGRSAEFRGASPAINYTSITVRMREAGQTVAVTSEYQTPEHQTPEHQTPEYQAPDKRRTTVR